MRRDNNDTHWQITIDSPIGPLGLAATDQGLRAVSWRGEETSVKLPTNMRDGSDHPVLVQAAEQIAEYFGGDRSSFDLPLDLRGTDFQVAAWRALGDIPYGTARSYGEQAALIGRPRAVRAIGQANGRNPVPIVLPCHRVIGSDGSLVGFGGGLDTKTFLLQHEWALDR